MSKRFAASAILTAAIGFAGLVWQWYAAPITLPRLEAKALSPAESQEIFKAEMRQKEFIKMTLEAARIYERHGCDPWLAERTAAHAMEFGLPVRIVAADVVVESSCRPDVVSKKGAVGLTQVMPKIWGYSRTELRDPDTNLEAGSRILAGFVHRFGMREGLRRYLGTGVTDGNIDGFTYADRVLAVAYR